MIELFKTEPTTDPELHQIEQRHTLDARWFDGGLHDPNSYVTMAHKDRGALLERLRALRTGEKALLETYRKVAAHVVTNDVVRLDADLITIPKAAWDWLMGEGPDDTGRHFGDSLPCTMVPNQRIPAFWWRTTFRRMCGR